MLVSDLASLAADSTALRRGKPLDSSCTYLASREKYICISLKLVIVVLVVHVHLVLYFLYLHHNIYLFFLALVVDI